MYIIIYAVSILTESSSHAHSVRLISYMCMYVYMWNIGNMTLWLVTLRTREGWFSRFERAKLHIETVFICILLLRECTTRHVCGLPQGLPMSTTSESHMGKRKEITEHVNKWTTSSGFICALNYKNLLLLHMLLSQVTNWSKLNVF